MSHGKSDSEIIETTHNTSRFFVETRHIAWVLLLTTCAWGAYGYLTMPQRKDPEILVRVAVAVTRWPGSSAEKIENLVTKKIEAKMAENSKVTKIESISRTSVSVVYVTLDEQTKETAKEFDDIKLKLDGIHDLPDGAGPITFIKDFGDTAALMLTVASPRVSDLEIAVRANSIKKAIETARAEAKDKSSRLTFVQNFPQTISPNAIKNGLAGFARYTKDANFAQDVRLIEGPGFIGLDGVSAASDQQALEFLAKFTRERLQVAELDPDVWTPVVIRDPNETQARLTTVAGEKYTYRDLDDYTDRIEKTLKTIPMVSKVTRSAVLSEKIFLEYSQERLASYNLRPAMLNNILSARNITLPGGQLQAEGKNISIDPAGEFKSEKEIGDVLITMSPSGAPLYLRDLVDITRSYDSPPRYLNYFNWRDTDGTWRRSRAITLAVQMRQGEIIGKFGEAVDATLNDLKKRLPDDLIMARTSDQPLQVTENVHLFMSSLYEAIGLVVLVSLIGFWEWRSALIMALSIPITLAMTFGMMSVLGVDLQQVSIATLIIALGLLVDDPVVAGDAIKRELAAGHSSIVAAWLGPTKLATAIVYATITNIVAYLPFLLLTGDTGRFLYSLPIVIACSLIASRLVSMSFIPLLGYYLLRPKHEPSIEERRKKGFAARYYKLGTWAINNRWKVLVASVVLLVAGGLMMSQLKRQFFPKDLSYLSYIDVWLPEDAPFAETNEAARAAEKVILQTVNDFAKQHGDSASVQSLTTFVGGGGPRFWFSVSPELQQLNYAQIILQVKDKHDTAKLVGPLQDALSAKVPGARLDVRQLESGKSVGLPVAVRISGDDIPTLRMLADQMKQVFRSSQLTTRVRDDWGDESFAVKVETDSDRANMSGVSNFDVAASSAAGMNGVTVATLREGDKQIPVAARMRMAERAQLADIKNLYVFSTQGTQKVPLQQIASINYRMETETLRRRNQFRTIRVSCFPASNYLPSEVMSDIRPKLKAFEQSLPPGYKMEIGGEEESQVSGFRELAIVMGISVAAIFLALVFQFKHAIKPLIVFAAIPYGMVGAIAALWVMGAPFGFMAFLGIVSLVGVIVSHIIVLFDFIEEKHAEGEPLHVALLDAGIMRLRPVLITVGATVIALFPLAAHGGPLWEPMCYAQIGGLTSATFITLLLVPVIYAIFVLDLKLVKWDTEPSAVAPGTAPGPPPDTTPGTAAPSH
jgi:multidrug efflux pump subunit AcrB